MKAFKKIVLVFPGFTLLILIARIFLEKEYTVVREITINKSKTKVFDYVKYLKNQGNYSKWAMADPNMEKTYSGTDATEGFISAWESKIDEVGVGEQQIIGISYGQRIDYEIRFKVPFEAVNKAYMSTESITDSITLVKWGFNGEMNYPGNLILLFMNMDKILGPDLELGLQNLKQLLENKAI